LIARAAVLLAGTLTLAGAAHAQSSLQVPIQFDFLNPSARSLALGGAFVGLADDATAALVNPAGLIELTLPEVSVEGRYRSFSNPFLASGRLSGAPTGIGEDQTSGPNYVNIGDSATGLTYLSFVLPRGRLRFAAFRHELLKLEQQFASRGVLQNRGFDNRDGAFDGDRTLRVDVYGASAAYDAGRLWFGGGLLIETFSLGFEFRRYLHEDFYGAPDPQQELFRFTQDGDDVGLGAVAGVMVPVKFAKVGVSYKRGPRFDFSSFSGGAVGSQERVFSTFKVPDVFAAGVSATFDRALVTVEYTHVFHSQLVHEYVEVHARRGETLPRADRFTIADSNEFHAGAEYLLPVPGRPALRGGFWFDPDHSVHYEPTAANDFLDERLVASLSSGRDLWHGTAGGMVTVHPKMDIAVAVDYSSRSTVVSTSAIIRF
jgi:long-chain fatty acid transport protein